MNKILKVTLLVFGLMALETKAQNLLTFADSIRKEYRMPALAYAVIKSDKVLTMEVCGTRRSDSTEATTLQDKFHLGSNTKAITSYVAAKLIEDGKIGWQTTFFQLFPALKDSSLPDYQNITLQDLLSHRAGILPFTSGLEQKKVPKLTGSQGEKWRQFATWLLKQSPVKYKKEGFSMSQYSNAGYVLAAIMLEEASGKTWAELVTETLGKIKIKPVFGFPNKSNVHQPWGHRTGLAWGMGDNYIEPCKPNDDYNLDLIAPAGDISMSLPEYVKFLQEHLKGLKGKNGLLTMSSIQLMHYGLPEYALGWGNTSLKGKKISYHDGSGGTFYCHVILLKEQDLGIVIFSNIAGRRAEKAIYLLSDKLRTTFTKN